MYNYYFNLKRLQIENFFHRFISLSYFVRIFIKDRFEIDRMLFSLDNKVMQSFEQSFEKKKLKLYHQYISYNF